jgi:flagellar biosynthesis protein FlhG
MTPLPIDPPEDQADGLRRLFAPARPRVLAVVSNPHLRHGGLILERLVSGLGDRGRHTLVVDAGERSPAPHELAAVDLAACVEPLSRDVSYLAARNLALRYVDATGSTAGLLPALADAAPQAGVLLIHAGALELARLLSGRHAVGAAGQPEASTLPRPILLADDHPSSVTHAYAAMKVLVQRAGLWVFDLVLAAPAESPRAHAIPRHLARCAETFLGAALGHMAQVSPDAAPNAPTPAALRRLLAAQIGSPDARHGGADRGTERSAAELFESLGPEPATVPSSIPATPSTRSRHAFPEH